MSPAAPLHALGIYVAAGITAFGWAMGQLFRWDVTPWLPLWACAALLIYNADRLRPDPADALNLPARSATLARLRPVSLGLLLCASVVLVALPLLRGDWVTLSLVGAGSAVCLSYSAPLFGVRLKELPLLKTFFAPAIVVLAVLGLPLAHGAPVPAPALLILAALHACGLLLFNMILCDLRDLPGDQRTGIRSLPVLLGERATRRFLLGLLFAIVTLSAACGSKTWRILAVGEFVSLSALLLAIRQPRSEAFYEWWVEGLLFLPAIAVLLARSF